MKPTTPGYYLFHGVRLVRNNQRVTVDAPVEVLPIWKGQDSVLGVVMLGRQGRFPLSQFEGTWVPLPSLILRDKSSGQAIQEARS